MEMFFLILHYGSSSINAMAVMPQPYPKEQCEKLAAGYAGMQGKCIPVPKSDINMCQGAIPNTNLAYSYPCTKIKE